MAISTTQLSLSEDLASRAEQVFPKLTPVQIERVTLHGRRRAITAGRIVIIDAAGRVVKCGFVPLIGAW